MEGKATLHLLSTQSIVLKVLPALQIQLLTLVTQTRITFAC